LRSPTVLATTCTPRWCSAMPETLGFPQLAGGAVVTVGTFDGIHAGHREILRRLQERAAALGLPALLVSFRPHPLEVVNPSAAPMLLTPDGEQLDAIADSGPLLMAVLPFTPQLAHFSAAEFVEQVLLERYRMRELVIGYDHGLGRGRQGDASTLRSLGERRGFAVDVVEAALDAAGVPISSSAIRTSIAHGDLARARRALGRDYGFSGIVIPGHQRGRALGYPTLNIELSSTRKLLPPEGVYAVRARMARGTFGGMMNLGPRPTFGEFDRTLEVHLFDVSGDWYGETIAVELVRRLRDTVRFDGIDALVAQLGRDAADARLALTQA
jgi:riboflavin kinase/FMN adenylyltransferase